MVTSIEHLNDEERAKCKLPGYLLCRPRNQISAQTEHENTQLVSERSNLLTLMNKHYNIQLMENKRMPNTMQKIEINIAV